MLVLFAGFVVLRALHDIPASDFQQAASLLVGTVLGAASQASRPARKTDAVTPS